MIDLEVRSGGPRSNYPEDPEAYTFSENGTIMLSGATAAFILAPAITILVGLVFWPVARTAARGRCWPRRPPALPDFWFPPRAAHVRLHRDVGVALPG
jgi:hypothetical protein